MLRKNVAGQFLYFAGINATTGAALTGATFSVRRCIDGTFAAGGATITEDTGLGFYKAALTQADTNGNDLAFFFTATNAIPVCINVLTTAADPSDSVRLGLTALPNAAAGANGGLPTGDAAGRVDVSKIAGTSQTARDIGASVLLSSGTGTGQLDFTSGVVKSNVTQNAGSAITSAAGIQEVKVASLATGAITAAAIAADAIGASELAADAISEIAGAVWDVTLAGHLTGGTTGNALNAAGAAGDPWSTALPGAYSAGSAGYIIGTNVDATISSRLASASYTSPLDAAGTRTAIGMASANLDTQLSAIAGYIDTEVGALTTSVAAVKAKTDNLPSDPADQSAVEAAITAALTLDLTEAYRADGSPGSVAELLYEIVAHLGESSISGTTKTIRKVNGSTVAATFTLDDATTPTSITRAS